MGPLEEKSLNFAVRIVKLSKFLNNQKQYVLAQQIIKSGTSIGANIYESFQAETKPDFIHKLGIAQKECSETLFWLRLMEKSNLISKKGFDSLDSDCQEIMRLLVASIKTSKKNLDSTPKSKK